MSTLLSQSTSALCYKVHASIYKLITLLNFIFYPLFQTKYTFVLIAILAGNNVYAQRYSESPTPLKRLVVLSPHAVEILYTINMGHRIVATVDFADFPEQARSIPRIGNSDLIDYEKLLIARPDAVLLSKNMINDAIINKITQLNIEVIDTSVDTLSDIPLRMRQLGDITGNQTFANQQAKQFESQLLMLISKYSHKPKISVFYTMWHNPLVTSSSPWFNEILSICSATNVFEQSFSPYPQVTAEQVIARAPQLILYPEQFGASQIAIDEWQQWPELPAVRSDNIKKLTSDYINRTGPRVISGITEICEHTELIREQF
ncbi:helical backbone metal receptor [Shewanella maritima]|uniref:helical backbone metal receptor n=1 Tax=Shewanella maritima TaxID=2520507 RepID=UPI003736D4F4